MTAADRVFLLDTYADDLGAVAWWVARRFHRDADDVRQDLCVAVLVDGHTFDPSAVGFRRWVYCRWLARNRRKWVTAVELPDSLASREPDPADVAELRDSCRSVRIAVDALPVREGGVIRDWFGFAGSELPSGMIAADLGVSPARVCQLGRRGLERLRDSLR